MATRPHRTTSCPGSRPRRRGRRPRTIRVRSTARLESVSCPSDAQRRNRSAASSLHEHAEDTRVLPWACRGRCGRSSCGRREPASAAPSSSPTSAAGGSSTGPARRRVSCDGVVLVVPPGGPPPTPSGRRCTRCRVGALRARLVPADADIVMCTTPPGPSPGGAVRAVVAAVPGADGAVRLPVADTIKQVDADGVVVATPDRARLRRCRPPRLFAPTRCARPTPAAARAPTTPHWWRRPAAGSSPWRAIRQPQAHEPADLEWARQRVTGRGGGSGRCASAGL